MKFFCEQPQELPLSTALQVGQLTNLIMKLVDPSSLFPEKKKKKIHHTLAEAEAEAECIHVKRHKIKVLPRAPTADKKGSDCPTTYLTLLHLLLEWDAEYSLSQTLED